MHARGGRSARCRRRGTAPAAAVLAAASCLAACTGAQHDVQRPGAAGAALLTPATPSPAGRPGLSQAPASTRTAQPTAAGTPGPPAGRPAPDYSDPRAVARAYLQARFTYRYDDLRGYRQALTAPALTTAPFAARSTPDPAALARLLTAQETAAVTVLSAAPSPEAPNSATTAYVTAQFTVTATYRGAGSGQAERHIWSLRLARRDAAGQWRVDGVVVAG